MYFHLCFCVLLNRQRFNTTAQTQGYTRVYAIQLFCLLNARRPRPSIGAVEENPVSYTNEEDPNHREQNPLMGLES